MHATIDTPSDVKLVCAQFAANVTDEKSWARNRRAWIIPRCTRHDEIRSEQHKSINLVSIITGYGRALSHGLTPKEKWKPKLRKYAGITFAQNRVLREGKPQTFGFVCTQRPPFIFENLFLAWLCLGWLCITACVIYSALFPSLYFISPPQFVSTPCKSCTDTSTERELTWPANICNLQQHQRTYSGWLGFFSIVTRRLTNFNAINCLVRLMDSFAFDRPHSTRNVCATNE